MHGSTDAGLGHATPAPREFPRRHDGGGIGGATAAGLSFARLVRPPRWALAPPARWLLPVSDFTGVLTAALLGSEWTGGAGSYAIASLLLPLATVLLLAARGAYCGERRMLLFEATTPALAVVSVAAMLTIGAGHALHPAAPDSTATVVAWVLALVLIPIGRAAVAAGEYWSRVHGHVAASTLILGAGTVGVRVAQRLLAGRRYGLRPIGFLDDDPPRADPAVGRPLPVLGGLGDIAEVASAAQVEHVVIAFTAVPDRDLAPLVTACAKLRVGVSVVPRLFDCINHRALYEPLGGLPLLRLSITDPDGWRFAAKHAFDRVLAVTGIVLLAPVGLAIALAVKLSSPGPILFSQVRVGRDGQVFRMLKFRTMRTTGAMAHFTPPPGCAPGGVEGEDRRTPVGRFLRRTSLDELPQLFNVLSGRMSIVGPRPERPEFVDLFAPSFARYDDRHRVRSGLTGLSQVKGLRGQSPIGDRVELDNFYIEHWSFALDLKVMLLTLLAIVRSGG